MPVEIIFLSTIKIKIRKTCLRCNVLKKTFVCMHIIALIQAFLKILIGTNFLFSVMSLPKNNPWWTEKYEISDLCCVGGASFQARN